MYMIFHKEQIHYENGVTYHFIPTKKFKTIAITAKLRAPLNRETVTKRALLPYILKQGTANYPSRKQLQLKLDELYGAILSINSGKKGENHIMTLRLEMANEQYIPNNEAVFKEGMALFQQLLFEPNAPNASFDPSVFNREKETLRNKIQSIQDDKMKYANMRLIDEMCAGEPYQLHVHGYEEDLDRLEATDLYQYYESMVAEDELDIYVVGDFDLAEMQQTVTSQIKRPANKGVSRMESSENEKQMDDRPQEIVEQQEIQQAKLHLGYRTNTTYQDETYAALQVFNGLFGGFPNSKLFINVREKNSLAYYAASRIESHKGLLFVFSGIAPENYEKARDIIRLQMQSMKNGEFTDVNLNETKELIVNQLLETMDASRGMVELSYQQVIGGKQTPPEKLIEQIRNVTKEDVIQVARRMEEDTVYLLTSKGGVVHE